MKQRGLRFACPIEENLVLVAEEAIWVILAGGSIEVVFRTLAYGAKTSLSAAVQGRDQIKEESEQQRQRQYARKEENEEAGLYAGLNDKFFPSGDEAGGRALNRPWLADR